MSKFKVVNLLDKLFVSVAVFLIIYAWLNFYIRDLWPTFILSLIFTGAVLCLLFYFSGKRKAKELSSKSDIEQMEKSFLNFRLSPKKEKLELIRILLEKDMSQNLKNEQSLNTNLENEQSLIDESFIKIGNNQIKDISLKNGILSYTKEDKKHIVILATHIQKLSENDLINLVDEFCNVNIDAIDIFCNEYDISCNKKIFIDKDIHLISKSSLYKDYFKKHNIYPSNININNKVQKVGFKDILKNMFRKERSRSYFFCGLILLFSSLILPYFKYYIIMGSLLMTFAVICKMLPHFQKEK